VKTNGPGPFGALRSLPLTPRRERVSPLQDIGLRSTKTRQKAIHHVRGSRTIERLKGVYDMDCGVEASHKMVETEEGAS
jgi:hypothetical protein